VRTLLAVAALLAVLVVLAVVRAAFDDGPTSEERRCHQLRAEADAVAEREDTIDDEVDYVEKSRLADEACAAVD
jgi:hypothetical protein